MGEVVYWTIIRTAVVIPALWFLKGYVDYQLWWLICIVGIYGIIIHPMIIRYRLFEQKNKNIIESTLCSSCKHFDKTAVLCMKYDKHPTTDYLPCEGVEWEPVGNQIDTSIRED